MFKNFFALNIKAVVSSETAALHTARLMMCDKSGGLVYEETGGRIDEIMWRWYHLKVKATLGYAD
jgi:hypothetical protein